MRKDIEVVVVMVENDDSVVEPSGPFIEVATLHVHVRA